MAGILDGLDIPKWMTPQQWNQESQKNAESIGRNVSSAVGHVLGLMSMMQGAQQAKDGLALKTKEFEGSMEIDRGKLKLGEEKIQFQKDAQAAMLRDQQRLAGEMAAWHSGGPLNAQPEAQYETRSGMTARDKALGMIEKGSAEHQAELDINKTYGKIVSTLPKSLLEFKQAEQDGGRGGQKWLETYDKWNAKLEEHDQSIKHHVETGPINAFQLTGPDGKVIPNSPWVYHGENGAVHVVTQKPDPTVKEQDVQRKFEMGRLGKQIDEANKALAMDPQDKEAKARVDALNKQKDALFNKTPKNTLIWDDTTQNFKP